LNSGYYDAWRQPLRSYQPRHCMAACFRDFNVILKVWNLISLSCLFAVVLYPHITITKIIQAIAGCIYMVIDKNKIPLWQNNTTLVTWHKKSKWNYLLIIRIFRKLGNNDTWCNISKNSMIPSTFHQVHEWHSSRNTLSEPIIYADATIVTISSQNIRGISSVSNAVCLVRVNGISNRLALYLEGMNIIKQLIFIRSINSLL
jgi:hypothetical protein